MLLLSPEVKAEEGRQVSPLLRKEQEPNKRGIQCSEAQLLSVGHLAQRGQERPVPARARCLQRRCVGTVGTAAAGTGTDRSP